MMEFLFIDSTKLSPLFTQAIKESLFLLPEECNSKTGLVHYIKQDIEFENNKASRKRV
jgi:hypothetical protein